MCTGMPLNDWVFMSSLRGFDFVFEHVDAQLLDERGIGWADNPIADIDDTAMGLRILKLHGYDVSSGDETVNVGSYRLATVYLTEIIK